MRIRVGSREIETPTLGESLRRGYESYQAVSSEKRNAESLSLLRGAEARRAGIDTLREELELNLLLKSATGKISNTEYETLKGLQGESSRRAKNGWKEYMKLLEELEAEAESGGGTDDGAAQPPRPAQAPSQFTVPARVPSQFTVPATGAAPATGAGVSGAGPSLLSGHVTLSGVSGRIAGYDELAVAQEAERQRMAENKIRSDNFMELIRLTGVPGFMGTGGP